MRCKVFVAVFMLAATSALAHHGFSMFDLQKDVTYTGTVVEYNWENPHTHIIVKVEPGTADPSTVGTWDIECQSIAIMFRQGWTKESYKPGDKITVVAHPLKNGMKGASIFYAVKADGSRLYGDIARPKQQ